MGGECTKQRFAVWYVVHRRKKDRRVESLFLNGMHPPWKEIEREVSLLDTRQPRAKIVQKRRVEIDAHVPSYRGMVHDDAGQMAGPWADLQNRRWSHAIEERHQLPPMVVAPRIVRRIKAKAALVALRICVVGTMCIVIPIAFIDRRALIGRESPPDPMIREKQIEGDTDS